MVQSQLPLAISTDNTSTFTNYFVSPANLPVVTALKQWAIQDRESTEPFIYIWGSPGSGISHLLEAVQHHIVAAAPSLSVQYLPMKLLTDYSPGDILEAMERMDVICFDDIELACRRVDWEQGLFHLLNRLRDQGKRLLIGSHSPPRQLPMDLADLKSRLQWATVFHLHNLTDEEKQQLLMLRAEKVGLQLSLDVAAYLLQRTGRSLEQLMLLLKQLDQASLVEQRRLTIPFVKKILEESG